MSEENRWERPASPPPPMFLGEKERNLVKQLNDEVIERVVGQTIVYYPIDAETTNYHPLYGEAIVKTYLPPIRVLSLVEYDGINTAYEASTGLDKDSTITVHFHKRRLTEDQNLFVREGDFVAYGSLFYEIMKLEEPKALFGQIEHKFEISAICKRSRKNMFDGE